MTYILIFILWLSGAAFSGAVFSKLGEKNPTTFGDCWTGDNSLDLVSLLLWPLSWAIFASLFAGHLVGKKMAGCKS